MIYIAPWENNESEIYTWHDEKGKLDILACLT